MTKKKKESIDKMIDTMVEDYLADCTTTIEVTTCPKHIGYIFQKINEVEHKLIDGKFEAFTCKTCHEQHGGEYYIHLQIV